MHELCNIPLGDNFLISCYNCNTLSKCFYPLQNFALLTSKKINFFRRFFLLRIFEIKSNMALANLDRRKLSFLKLLLLLGNHYLGNNYLPDVINLGRLILLRHAYLWPFLFLCNIVYILS